MIREGEIPMSQVLIREVFPVAAGAYETAGEASAAIKRKLKQLGVDSCGGFPWPAMRWSRTW